MNNEIEIKPLWKSKTLIGIMVIWFGMKLKMLGLDIPDTVLKNITDLFIEGGSILAVLGRMVAQQKLQ